MNIALHFVYWLESFHIHTLTHSEVDGHWPWYTSSTRIVPTTQRRCIYLIAHLRYTFTKRIRTKTAAAWGQIFLLDLILRHFFFFIQFWIWIRFARATQCVIMPKVWLIIVSNIFIWCKEKEKQIRNRFNVVIQDNGRVLLANQIEYTYTEYIIYILKIYNSFDCGCISL